MLALFASPLCIMKHRNCRGDLPRWIGELQRVRFTATPVHIQRSWAYTAEL